MLDDIFDRLAMPFDENKVSWRVGSTNADKTKGMALAYIDARDVMERLDLVCGPANWQCRYPHANGKTVCDIGLRVEREDHAEWIWKSDGAGDTDFEAEKGALSDSFKRAAVRWGIGRYLYELPSPWVDVEAKGKSCFIKKDQEPKLRALLRTHMGATKSSAQAKRDGDFEHFKDRLAAATDLEELGAIGREIKQALPMMPAAMRDPLHDAYAQRRDEIQEAFRPNADLGLSGGADQVAAH